MPPKIHIEGSFLTTEDSVLETLVLRYERRLESDLRRDPENPKVAHLWDLCNILWTVIRLKGLNKLTKNKAKKLMSAYTNKLRKI